MDILLKPEPFYKDRLEKFPGIVFLLVIEGRYFCASDAGKDYAGRLDLTVIPWMATDMSLVDVAVIPNSKFNRFLDLVEEDGKQLIIEQYVT